MATKKSTRHYSRKPTTRQTSAARRQLATAGALPPEPGDPELGEVLEGIFRGMDRALEVAIAVAEAIRQENTIEATCAAGTLQRGCANELSSQLDNLEKVIKGACLAGSRIVINSNKLAAGGDSHAPVQP